MGCLGSSVNKQDVAGTAKKNRQPKPLKFPQPITWSQLVQMCVEFRNTAPHYGGKKEIWDAIHAAAEADIELAQAIVDSAGIVVHTPDMTICYDERGAKYEIPKYVLSEQTNLIRQVERQETGDRRQETGGMIISYFSRKRMAVDLVYHFAWNGFSSLVHFYFSTFQAYDFS